MLGGSKTNGWLLLRVLACLPTIRPISSNISLCHKTRHILCAPFVRPIIAETFNSVPLDYLLLLWCCRLVRLIVELLVVQYNGLRVGHVLRAVVIPEMGTVQHYSVNL